MSLIIDFGMSRGNGFEKLDFPGGTRGFTAPENFDSESGASVAVDIYSIGKLLEMMDRKGTFKAVCKKCLSPDPEKRPESASVIPELLDQSLIRSRRRKHLYTGMSVSLGIALISLIGFWIWRNVKVSENRDQTMANLPYTDSVSIVSGERSDSGMMIELYPG